MRHAEPRSPFHLLRRSIRRTVKAGDNAVNGDVLLYVLSYGHLTFEHRLLNLGNTRPSPWTRQITADIARTFPSHPFFTEKEGVGQHVLYNVIKAYSCFDQEVGYCQGNCAMLSGTHGVAAGSLLGWSPLLRLVASTKNLVLSQFGIPFPRRCWRTEHISSTC